MLCIAVVPFKALSGFTFSTLQIIDFREMPASTGSPNISIVSGESVAISNRTSAMIDVAKVQGQVRAQSVQKVGELAEKNPHEAVSVIRSWLHEDAA